MSGRNGGTGYHEAVAATMSEAKNNAHFIIIYYQQELGLINTSDAESC